MPISRLSECLSCRCELHVCRMCEFYDPSVAQDCREPLAEEVKDKTRANFCEHFYPRAEAVEPASPPRTAPSAELDALFGEAPAASVTESGGEGTPSEASDERARQQLEALFGENKPD